MSLRRVCLLFALVAIVSLPAMAITPKVLTVPWDPSTPSTPHDAYSGATVVLGATVPNIYGSSDTFTYQWNYGDTSPLGAVTALPTSSLYSNPGPYNIGTTHAYSGVVGTLYTATVTVTDMTTGEVGSNSYLVEMQPNTLVHTVNVAIDSGLWYLHSSMWRTNAPSNGQPVNWGGWENNSGSPGCVAVEDCTSYGGIDATNVEAFEVKGHLENVAQTTDPYSDDVARGLAREEYFLIPYAVSDTTGGSFGTNDGGPYSGVTKNVNYNPANTAVRCSDGTQPTSYGPPAVCATGTPISYNSGATSCTSPPCPIVYDLNSNGQMVYEGNDSGDPGYQLGMFVTSFVASANPTGTAKAGVAGILGEDYKDLVTDMVDAIGYCQYYGDDEESSGYHNGGAWQYYCAANPNYTYYYDDNSPSQWNATALISANRAFGVSILPIIKDTSQVWTIWSQQPPLQVNPYYGGAGGDYKTDSGANPLANSGSLVGAYGYDEWGYEPWGPFADTPSGMVQLAMDDVGRTGSGATDQRWNWAESFMHDNFCNGEAYTPDSSYYTYDSEYSPRWYMYGLFSFTKAMLLHDPGGVLTQINSLEDQPSGTNPIDWYGAQASAGAPCDGVAQTLVSRQQSDGSWYYYSYYPTQWYFDTAWAVIMLNKTVFIQCIDNLYGRGSPGSGSIKPMVNLSWSPQTNAVSYNVLRGTKTGGPYTMVGNTTFTDFSDRTAGLVNGDTYYYVVQPVNSAGTEICTSNEEAVKIP
jgi:hypothetical protein